MVMTPAPHQRRTSLPSRNAPDEPASMMVTSPTQRTMMMMTTTTIATMGATTTGSLTMP
jgi:hypothetical protein